jgi:hypothetical protein
MTRVKGFGDDPVAVSVPWGTSEPGPAGSPCWEIYNWLCTASVGGRGKLAGRLVGEPVSPLDDRGRAGLCRVYTGYLTLRKESGLVQVETVEPEQGMQKGWQGANEPDSEGSRRACSEQDL